MSRVVRVSAGCMVTIGLYPALSIALSISIQHYLALMVPAPRVSLQPVSVVTPFIMLINGRITCAQPGQCLHIPGHTIYHTIHRARAPAASPRLRAPRRLCAVRGPWSVEKADCVVRRLGDKGRSGLGEGEMLEYHNIRIICCCSTSCFQLRLLAVLAAAARATGCLHAGWPPHLPRLPPPPHFLPHTIFADLEVISISLSNNGMNESSDLSKMWSS